MWKLLGPTMCYEPCNDTLQPFWWWKIYFTVDAPLAQRSPALYSTYSINHMPLDNYVKGKERHLHYTVDGLETWS